MEWRKPLDSWTLSFIIERLTEDREAQLAQSKEVTSYDEAAGEAFLVRAEECGRIIGQMRKLLSSVASVPPPPPVKKPSWPH